MQNQIANHTNKLGKEQFLNILGTSSDFLNKGLQKLANKAYTTYNKEFRKHIHFDIVLPEEDEICAEIANQSYNKKSLRQKEIHGFVLDEKLSNGDIAVYVNQAQKICILGYRGTIMTKWKDLASDAQILLDIQGLDARLKAGLKSYDTCKRTYQHFALRVCGHSLGGTISYIVAKHRTADKCVAFNPGMAINTFFFQMIEDTIQKLEWTKHTKTYKILGDIVSTAAFVGDTKVFGVHSNDPIKIHTIENFIVAKGSNYSQE